MCVKLYMPQYGELLISKKCEFVSVEGEQGVGEALMLSK
jgi:hypothetical protein